jgi:glycolate oxidase FAD binding subunit
MSAQGIERPTTKEELAGCLRSASGKNRRIQLGGAFSKDAYGGPLPGDAQTVSASGLRRVLQYEPRDLTISVEAGLPWRELDALLGQNGQMIPLDPPGAATGTVGGVVASNLAGPRRKLYGTARDTIIGMSFALMDGRVVDAGGMVVKNVAGLDFQKLLIGSYGTLAAMTSVNFRVHPRPAGTRTFVFSRAEAEPALAERDRLLKSPLQPAALDLLNPAAAARCGLEDYSLLVRAQGSAAVLERYARDLAGYESWNGERETALWRAVEDFSPAFVAASPRGAVVRVSTTLTRVGQYAAAPAALVARAGTGVVYLHFVEAAEAARWAAETDPRLCGCVIEAAAPQAKAGLEMWPSPGDDFPVMERIKALFDPQNLLNPRRLHGRI